METFNQVNGSSKPLQLTINFNSEPKVKTPIKEKVNMFGRPITWLPITAQKNEIDRLVCEGFQVNISTPSCLIEYGVTDIEVELFYPQLPKRKAA